MSYKEYRRKVDKITRQQCKLLPDINKRSKETHLDHKISVRWGYDNNIDPSYIGCIDNLRLIPWIQNISKGKTNFIDESNKWILKQINKPYMDLENKVKLLEERVNKQADVINYLLSIVETMEIDRIRQETSKRKVEYNLFD